MKRLRSWSILILLFCCWIVSASVWAATLEGEISVTGIQTIAKEGDCTYNEYNFTGMATGTVNDGNGLDNILFRVDDDGDTKDSKTVSIPVGETIDFSVTLRFEGIYKTAVAGVALVVDELGYFEENYIPDEIAGICPSETSNDPDVDDDGDGYTENQGDCNDADASIHPEGAVCGNGIEICGDGIDQNCDGVDSACGSYCNGCLIFPRVVSCSGWETRIGLINPSASATPVSGIFRAYTAGGEEAGSLTVTLPGNGRKEIEINEMPEITAPETIAYCTFDDNGAGAVGYAEWNIGNALKAAVPAQREALSGAIVLGNLVCSETWRTECSMVNTNTETKTLTLTFNTGESRTIEIPGNGAKRFWIRDLFEGVFQPGITSAKIDDATGIIGLQMRVSYMEGCSSIAGAHQISGNKSATIYFPHAICSEKWATKMYFNSYDNASEVDCTTFDSDGAVINLEKIYLNADGDYSTPLCDVTGLTCLKLDTTGSLDADLRLDTTGSLDPADYDNCWLKVESNGTLLAGGSEDLIGVDDENIARQMASLNAISTGIASGVIATLAVDGGWTGLGLINPADTTTATVDLIACDDNGTPKGAARLVIAPHAKKSIVVEELFAAYDISSATWIAFNSSSEIFTFVLQGSADGLALEALPGIAAPFTFIDNDGDGYPVGVLDCDDNDPAVHMNCAEPVDPNTVDDDGDGYSEDQGDCNDNDATIHPGADDICGDGIDQDCNGSDLVCDIPVEPVDPNTIDNDGDGYSENQGDCNDSNAAIHPGADDICGDGIDQDCNGSDLVCDIPVAVGLASSHYGTYRVTSIQADTNGSQDCLFVGDEATITDNQSLHDMDNYVWIPRNIATYSNTYIDSDGDTVTQTETISANMLIMDEIGTWGDEPDKGWNVHLEIDFENLTFTLTETDSEIYDGCEGTYRGTLVKID